MTYRIFITLTGAACLWLMTACSAPRESRMTDDSPRSISTGSVVRVPDPAPLNLSTPDGHLSLSALIQAATERNPRLRASREIALARRERRPQVTALPDPTLKLGWYAEEVQTRTGAQSFVVGLSQRIPWPTKLVVAGEIADIGARMATVRTWIAEREVILEVARHYHELAHLEAATRVTIEIESLWNDLVTRASTLPGIAQAERVRAETRASQARYDREVMLELAEIQRATLRSLAALPSDHVLPEAVILNSPRMNIDLKRLESFVNQGNQELLLADLAIKSAEARIEAAELAMYPDFSASGRYIVTDARPDGVDPIGNGDDPLYFELGITLPLQRNAKIARKREAWHEANAQAHKREDLRLSLRRRLAEHHLRARNEARLVDLHQTVLNPQAEHAAREAEALVAAGSTGLAGLFETIAARHQVQLGDLRARTDYALRLTQIEAVIGHPLQSAKGATKP